MGLVICRQTKDKLAAQRPSLVPLLARDNTSGIPQASQDLLVYLYDVSFWIVKEHLMPLFRKCSSVVRVRNVLTIQHLLLGFYVVSPKRNMPSLDWVNSFTMLKTNF